MDADISFWTKRDAARVLHVAPETVSNWADKGDLPIAAKTQRGVRLFDPAAVRKFAESRRKK